MVREAAARIRLERCDSAPPKLGTPPCRDQNGSDPATPEEHTWPADGFSVHGNSSNETVNVLVSIRPN